MCKVSRMLGMLLLFLLAAVILRAQPPTAWQIPPDAQDLKSPLSPTPDLLKKGRAVFTAHCQKCHGPEGKGNGPDSDKDHPAANLTESKASANTDGVLFYKVWNGRVRPKMPAFKSELTKDEVWQVVEYAKTLRQ